MKYLEQLTWLRGLAAFFVIVEHSLQAANVSLAVTDKSNFSLPLSLLGLGALGVTLFFALSGCTLYLSNANKLNAIGILVFYLRRFFRIWPTYFISLLFYLVFICFFKEFYGSHERNWIENQFNVTYSLLDVIKYLSLVFNITGPMGFFNVAYWSLPVEFQYYLFFPLAVFSLKKIGVVGPVILGGVFFLYPSIFGLQMRWELFNLAFVFFGGILIGYFYQATLWRMSMGFGCFITFVIVTVASLYSNEFIKLPAVPGYYISDWTWYGIFSLIALFVVLFTQFNDNHYCFKGFLKNYGDISYSTYLYHNLFVGIAVLIVKKYAMYDGQLKLWFILLFTLIGTYFLANLSYRYIEIPAINYGRRIAKKLND